jgi:RES domain
MQLIEKALGIGFFYYGPRLWMVGQVDPLIALQDDSTRASIIARIISEYPVTTMSAKETFYRLRKDPAEPTQFAEYDSQPIAGIGRLDSNELPVMYGSQDLQVCVHECRVTAEDNLFVATLQPKRDLRLLDIAHLLPEEQKTEFESLDMAVHMLFLAGKHSYPIARKIALAAHKAEFDGLVYPSYFSLLRTGAMPFETVMGISYRRIPQFAEYETAKTIRNLAIFRRPIQSGLVGVQCVNKLIMHKIDYDMHFGPVGVDPDPINGDGKEPTGSD